MALSKSYLTNLGKSLYYSAKTAVKNEMPIVTGTYEKNKEEFKTGTQYLKSFVTKKGTVSTHGVNSMVSQFLKDLDEVKKNAFDDLRTGRINNFDREMQAMEREFGGFNLDGGSDSSFGFNMDDDDSDAAFSINEDSNSISFETKVSETGSNKRTKALMGIITDSAESSANYITNNNRKLSSMHMNLMSQMHTEVIKTMTDTNNLLTNVVEFQNNQMVDYMNKTYSFYDNMLTELREIKEGLIPKKEDHSSKPVGFEDILSSSGLDLKAYGQVIKKNFGTWFSGTSLGMAASFAKLAGGQGGIMGAIKGNPLGFISDLIVSGLMPNSLKVAMGRLDKSLAGLFSSMVLGLNKMKGDFSSPLNQMIGAVFGIDISGKRAIDTSRFHKGVMQYNGRADKALTEVIPALLSHILSAVRGTDKVSMYNYTTGKFTETGAVIKEHKDRLRESATYEMSNVRDSMMNRLAKISGGSSEFMMDELDSFLEHLVVQGKHYNPYTSKKVKDLEGLNLKDPRSYNIIRAAFMSMPKSMQNRMAHEIIKGRVGSTRAVENIENELKDSGLGIAYAGLEPPKVISKTFGITNGLLKDIKNILTEGIKVVQIGTVQGSPSLLKRITGRKLDKNDYGGPSKSGGGGTPPNTPIPDGRNDLQKSFHKTEDQLMKEMSTLTDVGSQSNGFRKFVEEVSKQKTLRDKYRVFKQGMAPSNIITKGMNKVDEFLHTLIFGIHKKESSDGSDGDGDGPGDGPKKNSFFSRVTQRLSTAIDKSLKWVESKILTPLHERFFGEKGILTTFQQKFTPFLEKFKEFAKSKFEKFKEAFMGSTNQEGFYTGGIFADLGNSFKDYSNQIRHFFTGSSYKKSDGTEVAENKQTSVFGYVKNYSKSIMENIKTGLFGEKYETDEVDATTGEVKKVTKRKGGGLLSGVVDQLKGVYRMFDGLFKTKEGETQQDVDNSISQWRKELTGFLPKGIAGGLVGAASSALLPGGPLLWGMLGTTVAFASHSKKFREFLFGNEAEGREGFIPPHYRKILMEAKQSLPAALGGGAIGLGASILLPGVSPLLGLTLGSAIGYATHSKRVQEYLFGNGDDKKGVFGPEFKDKLKKFMPAIGAGGLLGLAGSAILPGGPLIGMTLGSAIGFASKSKTVSRFLFGETDEHGNIKTKGLISPEMRKKIKENLPKGIAGAMFGALSGTLTGGLLPGGPLVGAMVGASMSILSSSDKFKEFLFGAVDRTGKKVGGLLGNVRDFVRDEFLLPFKHWISKKGIVIKDWFENSIKTPFVNVMTPLKDAFGIIGRNIKDSWGELKDSFKKAFVDTFNNNIGIPLKEFMVKNITDPMKNMLNKFFTTIGKGLSAILTAPAKGLALFANSIIEADRKKDDKDFKKLGLSETKYVPFDIDTGMNIDKDNMLDNDYKDMVMEQRKKKLAEKLREYDRKHGLIELDPKDKLDMEYQQMLRNPKSNSGLRRTSFDDYFDAQISKSPSSGSIPSPEEMKQVSGVSGSGRYKYGTNLQMFGGGAPDNTKRKLNIIGTFDLDKFTAHNTTMLGYIREIRDEVHGQLDGVGHNVETIANIMLDTFGAPSIAAKGLKGIRGNYKKRGIFGRIMDVIKSPFRFMGNILKTVVLKPISALLSSTKKFFTEIPKMIGRGVSLFGKGIYNLVKLPFQAISGVAKAIGGIGKSMIKFFNSGFFKSIGKFASTLVDGLITKPLKGLFTVVQNVTKGLWDITKGIGSLFKDALVGMTGLVKDAIPALGKGIRFLGKGILELGKGIADLTVTVGKAVWGMAKFAAGAIGKGFRAVGRMFGLGKKATDNIGTTGLSGSPVYVVGGALDRINRIDEIEKVKEVETVKIVGILSKIEECVRVMGCSGGKNTNARAAARRMGMNTGGQFKPRLKLDLQTFGGSAAATSLAPVHSDMHVDVEQDTAGGKRLAKFKQRIFKTASMFAKAGAFIGRMSKGKWNETMPRIMAIENLTKNVKNEQDYHNATIGLLNELTISNIQLLESSNRMNGDEKSGSLLDTLKGIGSFLKNSWPLLTALIAPYLKDLWDAAKDLGKKLKDWWRGGPDVDTPDRRGTPGSRVPPAGGTPPGTVLLPPPVGGKKPPIGLPGGKSNVPALPPAPGRIMFDEKGRPIIDMSQGKDGSYGKKMTLFEKLKGATSKAGSVLGKGLKRVPILGTALMLGAVGANAYALGSANSDDERDNTKKNIWGSLGGIAGGMAAGAGLGALGGSIVPGAGTVIGGIVGGVGGAILGEAGVRRLYENKGKIGDWASQKYNQVKNFTTDTFSGFWNSAPIETARNLTTGFITMISEVGSGIYDAGAMILKSIGGLMGRLWDQFKEWLSEKWDSWVVEPIKGFGTWVSEAWDKTKDWVAEKWDSWIVQPLDTFGTFVNEKWIDIKNWFAEKWDEYVPEPVKIFLADIKGAFAKMGDWIGEKWESWISNPIQRALGAIREGFIGVGDWIGEKWNEWIVDPLKKFGSGLKNLWNKTTDWVSDMWGSIFGDRGESAKKKMIETGVETGDSSRRIGSRISNWLNSIAVSKEKGGADPAFGGGNDLSYAIKGAIPGTDATSSDLEMIRSIANKFGVNPHLWLALAETESSLYSKAANPVSTARGWGQLLDTTAKDVYERTLKLGSYNHDMAFDKNINATMSIAYLRQMFDYFNGDATKAILAYNVGPGNVERGIGINDDGGYGAGHGKEYLQKVLKNLRENTGLSLRDVADASKMSPIDYAILGATTGAAMGTNAGSTGMKEVTMASTLGAMGAFLGGDKLKELYGFNPSDLVSNLDTELMKKSDPFYAAISGGSSTSTFNPGDGNYDSENTEIKRRNSSLFPHVSGDNDIHEFMAARLNNIAKAYGKSLSINSGHRSDAEQIELINEWKSKNPGASESERRRWVADPERSNHAVGIAADISGWIQQLSPQELAKFGLYRPLDWEPWHFEPLETKIYGRSRSELTPLYGTPMNPNPNLSKYLSKEFLNVSGSGKTSFDGIDAPQLLKRIGGGDPLFDNSFGPPDITQYSERVRDAVTNNSSDPNSSHFVKMIHLLAVIATAVEKLVDISDETRGVLKTYFENVSKQYSSTKTLKSSRPITNSTAPPPSNPLGSANKKRSDKSAIIAQIAKGTTL